MRRLLLLCVIVTLGSGCEQPARDGDRAATAAPTAQPAEPAATSPRTTGEPSVRLPLSGAPRRSKYVQLGVIEAGFDPAAPPAPAGERYFTVGLKGVGRARGNDFVLEIEPYVFAQNEKGCIARPQREAPWLENPFGATVTFTTVSPTEGHLTFLVPGDTERIRVLIASADSAANMILPAGAEFEPAWPTPLHVIEDGSTLRMLVLPSPEVPAVVPAPAADREFVLVDLVIENLQASSGIEFTTSQQLRLADPLGHFIQPSPATRQLGCRLDDGDVVPPGQVRRLMVLYDVPAGMPRRLQYRGFEVDEAIADLD